MMLGLLISVIAPVFNQGLTRNEYEMLSSAATLPLVYNGCCNTACAVQRSNPTLAVVHHTPDTVLLLHLVWVRVSTIPVGAES